jgi:hypothetical protein
MQKKYIRVQKSFPGPLAVVFLPRSEIALNLLKINDFKNAKEGQETPRRLCFSLAQNMLLRKLDAII